MDPWRHEPDQLDPGPASDWPTEPRLFVASSQIASAWPLFKKLIHIWPAFDVEVVPQLVKAITGLCASDYAVGLFITFASSKPCLLWFGVICIFITSKWGCPNLSWLARNNATSFSTSDVLYLNGVNIVWFLVPALYILKFLLIPDVRYSSVWCSEPQHQLRTCRFRNLYYDTHRGFLFALDESSVISGIQNYEEFKNLRLSPIADHKGVNMKIIIVKGSDVAPLSLQFYSSMFFEFTKFIEQPHFVLHRFKPDNLMHVVHDDLIPLFFKFRELSTGDLSRMVSTTNLFFADMNDYGPFVEWYQALSSSTPLLAKSMSVKKLYCFSSLLMGAANTSFFQYGFNKPQGSIGPNVAGRDIQEFKRYYLDYFDVEPDRADDNLKVTLISRAINRKIINKDKIFSALSTLVNEDGSYSGKKLVMAEGDLVTDIRNLLKLVASSDIVVAMHGAETILSLCLPDSSVFIEMFPYGISRDNVSPVYSLSKAVGVHFRYLSWDNVKEQNSIVHPEYPKEFGGTGGYPEDLKQRIYNTKRVPAVPCCDNPFYLFRMYQDTIIDDSFSEVASTALKLLKSKSPVVTAESQWFFPGPVLNLNCHRYPNYINLSWTAPHNVEHLKTKYDVLVSADTVHRNVVTNESVLRFDFGERFRTVEVWVSSEVSGKKSVDSYCKCSFTKSKLNHLSL